ncbi:MAG: D-glycero-beta-D-manno-heptose-7-phosphate kinase [Vicinamibacterales bacterium]
MRDLHQLIGRLAGRRVGVIGDLMLDHFIVGRVERISPEAPVPVVCFEREEQRLGGAANVASNLRALGAVVTLGGLVGDDGTAAELRALLTHAAISDSHLTVDPERPTTRKTRVVTTRNQQVARIDREHDREPSGTTLDALIRTVDETAASCAAIVLSDYRKGVVSAPVIAAAAAAAEAHGIPLLVDPKVAQAGRYRGASLLTPNHHEAELMTHLRIRSTSDARDAARALHADTGGNILITRGEQGMWILDASGDALVEQSLPAVAREVSDVTGAGDTVIAVLALALAAGATLVEAATLANLAAGLVVARFGPATVSTDELAAAVAAN